MKELFESDSDHSKHVGNGVHLYYETVRLRFTISTENFKFQYNLRMADPFDITNHNMTEEQVISGQSNPIDNSKLPQLIFNRQPNANKIFDGRQIYMRICERPKENDFSPFFISTDESEKRELSMVLHWDVSDRSLFSRLVTVISNKPLITFEVITNKIDKDFGSYVEGVKNDFMKAIGVKGVSFA